MTGTHPQTEAELLDRLARIEGKAEIINGEIIEMPPTGGGPGYAGDAIFVGELPGMGFYDGAPIFAVEVRSENDYGPAAEIAMALKRGLLCGGNTGCLGCGFVE